MVPADASWLTLPFWEAAARGELTRPVCDACGRSFFSPQLACPHCGSEAWTWTVSSGRGTVYSATVVHRPPSPDFTAPYVVAVVDLDGEGWSLLANIVDCEPSSVTIGLPVTVAWRRTAEGAALPAFAPRSGA